MSIPLIKCIEGTNDIYRFVLAGRAQFAIKSIKTGAVYYYRVSVSSIKHREYIKWWVRSISPHYQYIGGIYKHNHNKPKFHSTKDTSNPPSTEYERSIVIFTWFWDKLREDALPPSLEFYHVGKCGRCERKLTDPVSIAIGFGSYCYKQLKKGEY